MPYPTWAALAVARDGGDVEEARRCFDRLVAQEPRHAEAFRRIPGFAELVGLEPPAWPLPERRT